jgi:hypothetical protein
LWWGWRGDDDTEGRAEDDSMDDLLGERLAAWEPTTGSEEEEGKGDIRLDKHSD